MPTRLFTITFILLITLNPSATAQYKITSNCTEAWEALLDLRINTARYLIDKEMSENPENYYAYYLAQNCDAFELMINSSADAYHLFEDNYEKRREIMDDKYVESPYYLACESEMQLQLGAFNIIYGDKFTGLRNAYSAYKKINKNIEMYPEFQPNKKMDGIFNVAISNLPPFVSWAAKAFGVEGNAETGFEILKDYSDHCVNTPGLKQEAALTTILTYKLNKDPVGACRYISMLDSCQTSYKVLHYFKANVSYRSGRNEEALDAMSTFSLDNIDIPFNQYNYLYGKIMLRKLDTSAIGYFEKYLDVSKEKDYLKEIHYKLALSYLISGDKPMFDKHKQLACKSGDELLERDKEAMYDCCLDYLPKPELVRAKLLIEGGYYNQAKEVLDTIYGNEYIENLSNPYSLEYLLLNGKYEFFTENNELAITAFNKVIDFGEDEDYYFASEAAMYLGLIYESTDHEKAIEYFSMARDLYESEYYEYIDEISEKRIKSNYSEKVLHDKEKCNKNMDNP